MLNSLYTTWDEVCDGAGALGVDFSGSTYVAVSGHDDNPRHLANALKARWVVCVGGERGCGLGGSTYVGIEGDESGGGRAGEGLAL